MRSITKSPNISRRNLNYEYFNDYISKSPLLCSKSLNQENDILEKSCNCSCHCRKKNYHKFHHDSSYNNISSIKPRDLDLITDSDNNISNENKNIIKTKSDYNLTSNPNNKYYLFQELKKNYVPNYNYTTKKMYNNNINNNRYKSYNYNIHNDKVFNNHSFVDIKEINDNTNKKDIKYYKVKLQRKELSKFYHNIGFKKYPYSKGKLQTTTKTNNHKYTEIYGNSAQNNYNLNRNNKKRIIIHYECDNNENDLNINNINNINNIKIKNNNNIKGKYSFTQNFSRNKKSDINNIQKGNTNVESKILKDTYNTRLIEVKSPSKDKNNQYRSHYYLDENRKNLFDNYTYERKYEKNNNENNNNKKYNILITNNNLVRSYNNNVYKNHKRINIRNINENNNINQINTKKQYYTKYNHTPYCLSLGNKNIEINNNCNNINTEEENKKKLSILRNNRINNINYKILKQKVRLSLLKKQIYDQKRNNLFNNNILENPGLIYNDSLYEKTRKLMNNNNCNDMSGDYNIIDRNE